VTNDDRGRDGQRSSLKRYLPSNATLVTMSGLIAAIAALVTALSGCNPI
jgi:hypothetical protein